MVLWALANPLFAAPDEAAHLVRAQGFGQGVFTAPFPTDGLPLDAAECFSTEPDTTAGCMNLTWGAPGTTVSVPALSNYPPLLHLVAAPATWVGSGETNVYVVRIWLAVVCASLLAWAGTLLTRPGSGRWPLTGLMVAVTPMVVFTSATVNPSGLTAAFAAVGVAAVVVPAVHHQPLLRHWPALAVAVVGLLAVRRDSLLWIAVVAVALIPALAGGRWNPATLRNGLRNPAVVAATVAGVVGVAAAGVVAASRFGRWRSGEGSTVGESVRLIRRFVLDLIGNFGWLDAQLPPETFAVALVVVGFVVLSAVTAARKPWAGSQTALVAALFVSMVALETQRSLYLQGRYLFVVWMALMVTAGVAVATGGLPRRFATRAPVVLGGLWMVVHAVGFTHNLRRYAVGQNGPWTFITGESAWQPPITNAVAVGLFMVALVGAAAAVTVVMRGLDPTPRLADTTDTTLRYEP